MIKMRVNKNKHTECSCCNTKWSDTSEMIDVMINESQMFSLCKKCQGTMFQKLLKVSCMYDGRLKSKEDQARTHRERQIEEEKSGTKHLSINAAMKGVKVNGN